jgi:TonB family protein
MTRLEKKCFLASAALHGLLLLVILFGAAFLGPSKEKPLPNRLNVVPSRLVDAALAGGGGNPNLARTDEQVKGTSLNPADASPAPIPPPPKQPATVHAREVPPPQTRPQPPVRTEPVRPEPSKTPVAKPADKPKPNETVKPPELAKPTLDLTPTVRGPSAKEKAKAEAEAREAHEAARRQAEYRQRLADQLGKLASGLKAGFEGGTKVDVGGPGGEAYANYSSLVQAAYDSAWRVLPDLASKDYVVTVEVVVASNGRIVSQRILSRSGNSGMDKSVQNALDRVKERGLPSFPPGARDAEREFTIEFNLKAKRLLG